MLVRLGEPPVLAKSHCSSIRPQPPSSGYLANSIERNCTRTRMPYSDRYVCPLRDKLADVTEYHPTCCPAQTASRVPLACHYDRQPRSTARPGPVTRPATGSRPDHSSSAAFMQGQRVIMISEQSTKAARRVSTGRFKRASSRKSAARSNTPEQPDTRPIRVHTKRPHNLNQQLMPPAGLLRDRLRLGTSGGSLGDADTPFRRRPRHSRPDTGVEVVHPSGAPPRPLRLACFGTSPPTRRDTHLTIRVSSAKKPTTVGCTRARTNGQ
jgi:hypothetical protein